MAKIESVPCVPCAGKGIKRESITGVEHECKACEGSGMIFPCEAFSSSHPAVFRNRTCDTCYATEKQHELIKNYEELTNA